MTEARSFTYHLAMLRGDAFRNIAQRLFQRLEGSDDLPVWETGSREAKRFLNTLIREASDARSALITNREEPDDLADAVFGPLLDAAGGLGAEEFAEQVRSLRSILAGDWHLPHFPHTFGLTEPVPDHLDYGWKSQGGAARSLQREFRIAVRAVHDLQGLKSLRGIVVRRDPTPEELMIAGAAQAAGLPVASEKSAASWIPAFNTLEEAFSHVRAQAVALYGRDTTDEEDERRIHDDLLEVLIAKTGIEAGTAALMARCRILEDALADARSTAIRRADQEQIRSAEYVDLLRGSEFEKAFFDVYANYRRGSGSPEAVENLARAQRRIMSLEEEIANLKKEQPTAENAADAAPGLSD